MMRTPVLLLFLAVMTGLSLPARADERGGGVTVLELFTTQGCSNCPPADAILKKIVDESENDVVALACHITYFDRPDWKDTFSRKICDERQGGYFRSLGMGSMYTPELVINGRFETQGNRENLVRSGIAMSRSMTMVFPLEIVLRGDYLDIALPQIQLDAPADVWIAGYGAPEEVKITAGELSGETITYVNPVTDIKKLMNWDGKPLKMALPLYDMLSDGYAVLVQKKGLGDIIAAGTAREPFSRPKN